MENWDRFDKAARHVRILDVEGPELGNDLLGVMESTRPDSTYRIFPFVHTLTAGEMLPETLRLVLPLLPPSLQRIDITLDLELGDLEHLAMWARFIELIPRRFSNLRVLKMDYYYDIGETLDTALIETAVERLRDG